MTRHRPARRTFLIGAATGAGLAAAATTPPVMAAVSKPQDASKKGYRETEHVRRFYEVNRYPGGRHAR